MLHPGAKKAGAAPHRAHSVSRLAAKEAEHEAGKPHQESDDR